MEEHEGGKGTEPTDEEGGGGEGVDGEKATWLTGQLTKWLPDRLADQKTD